MAKLRALAVLLGCPVGILAPPMVFLNTDGDGYVNPDAIDSPCKFSDRVQLGQNLDIEIKPHDEAGFEALLRNEVENVLSGKADVISESSKVSFSSQVRFKSTAEHCELTGSIRLSGDWTDHLGIQVTDGTAVAFPSLDVELDGGYGGLREFKLFTAGTRNFESEVLGSVVLAELGFLTPANQVAQLSFLGRSYPTLMQEKIGSSLIELSRRPAGPIFEIDEQVVWGNFGGERFYQPHFARLVNRDYLRGSGFDAVALTARAHSRLQTLLISSQMEGWDFRTVDFDDLNHQSRWLTLTGPTFEGFSTNHFTRFWMLLKALKGDHGLAVHNRSFYFNPQTDTYEAIYYDGDLDFHRPWTRQELESLTIAEALDEVELSAVWDLKNDLQNHRDSIRAAFALREDMSLYLGDKHEIFAEQAVLSALGFLEVLINGEYEVEPTTKFTPVFWPDESHKFERLFLDVDPLARNKTSLSLQSCSEVECLPVAFGSSEIDDIFANRFRPGGALDVRVGDFKEITVIDQTRGFFAVGTVRSEQTDSSISVALLSEDARFIIFAADLDNYEVRVTSQGSLMTKAPKEHAFNEFGMTGCTEVLQSTLHNVRFDIQGGFCEDALHVANSVGKGISMNVRYSLADAIDIDRSHLSIDAVNVHSAANDCLDVSTSEVVAIAVSATACGDKILSVGENASTSVYELRGTGDLGLVSKDGAILNVDRANVRVSSQCVSVYQKKWIYSEGVVQYGQLDCRE